jgi:hypothetical protein
VTLGLPAIIEEILALAGPAGGAKLLSPEEEERLRVLDSDFDTHRQGHSLPEIPHAAYAPHIDLESWPCTQLPFLLDTDGRMVVYPTREWVWAMQDCAKRAGSSNAVHSTKKPKRSTDRGEGRDKIIAALTVHHQYARDSCLNLEAIGNNELARQARVSNSTVSAFFKKEFEGHATYRAICMDRSTLVAALKLLNGEYAPKNLLPYGRRPPGEGQLDDE